MNEHDQITYVDYKKYNVCHKCGLFFDKTIYRCKKCGSLLRTHSSSKYARDRRKTETD